MVWPDFYENPPLWSTAKFLEVLSKIIEKCRGETSDSHKRSIFIAMSWAIGALVYTESKMFKVFSLYISMIQWSNKIMACFINFYLNQNEAKNYGQKIYNFKMGIMLKNDKEFHFVRRHLLSISSPSTNHQKSV